MKHIVRRCRRRRDSAGGGVHGVAHGSVKADTGKEGAAHVAVGERAQQAPAAGDKQRHRAGPGQCVERAQGLVQRARMLYYVLLYFHVLLSNVRCGVKVVFRAESGYLS